jgi:amidohydrolase
LFDFLAEAQGIAQDLSEWRRDIHRHPELRFEEVRTAGKIAAHLLDLGLEVETGVGKTGVVGLLKGKYAGPVVLARFDMDALPIQEEGPKPYISQVPGVMHACGHDTHVAMGMGVAQILAEHRDELHGTVKFVFQPAEEGAGGALAMVADGVLENPAPDYSFGVHIDSQRRLGTVAIGEGPILAAADEFRILVHGKGGHGALPEQTIDALMVGTKIVEGLHTILSRNLGLKEAAVLSVCSFHSGSAFNVIPETAELTGTVRTYDLDTQETIHQRMRAIIERTAEAYGAQADFEIETIVPAVVNDPVITAKVREIAAEMFGAENLELDYREAPSDDVAEFINAAPGCHFILGAALNPMVPHHNAKFDIDESAMPLGTALLCAEITHYLSS